MAAVKCSAASGNLPALKAALPLACGSAGWGHGGVSVEPWRAGQPSQHERRRSTRGGGGGTGSGGRRATRRLAALAALAVRSMACSDRWECCTLRPGSRSPANSRVPRPLHLQLVGGHCRKLQRLVQCSGLRSGRSLRRQSASWPAHSRDSTQGRAAGQAAKRAIATLHALPRPRIVPQSRRRVVRRSPPPGLCSHRLLPEAQAGG